MATYDSFIGEELIKVGRSNRVGRLETNPLNSLHFHDSNNAWLIGISRNLYGGTILYKVRSEKVYECMPLKNSLTGKTIYETAYYFNDSRDTLNVVYRGSSSPGVFKIVIQTIKDDGQQSVKEYDVTGYLGGVREGNITDYRSYVFGLTKNGGLCAYLYTNQTKIALMKFLDDGISVTFLEGLDYPALEYSSFDTTKTTSRQQVSRKYIGRDFVLNVEDGSSEKHTLQEPSYPPSRVNSISTVNNRTFGTEPYMQLISRTNDISSFFEVRVIYIRNEMTGVMNFTIKKEPGATESETINPIYLDEENNLYIALENTLAGRDIFYKLDASGAILWKTKLFKESKRFSIDGNVLSKLMHNGTRLFFQNDQFYPQYGMLDTKSGHIFYYGDFAGQSQNSEIINSRYAFPSGRSPDVRALTYRFLSDNWIEIASLESASSSHTRCERKNVTKIMGGI